MSGPSARIQWKGSDICLDFRCECGRERHVDGDFVYTVTCEGCGAIWALRPQIALVRMTRAWEQWTKDDWARVEAAPEAQP